MGELTYFEKLLWRIRWWLRDHGLSPHGHIEVRFVGNCEIIQRWDLFIPTQWEVWYHGLFGLTAESAEDHYAPLPPGSRERYHRLQLSADRIYAGKSYKKAVRVAEQRMHRARKSLRHGPAVAVGQIWEYLGSKRAYAGKDPDGQHIVVSENDSNESPGSWVMQSLETGKTSYMHKYARTLGEWRCVQ